MPGWPQPLPRRLERDVNDPFLWYVIAWFVIALVPCGYWQYQGGEAGPFFLYLYGWIFLPPLSVCVLVMLVVMLPLAAVAQGFRWWSSREILL